MSMALLNWSVVGLLYDIVGAIFLVVAIFNNSPAKIAHQASTFWDSSPVAVRALSEQTIDARTGLSILITGFVFQIFGQWSLNGNVYLFVGLLILLSVVVILYFGLLRKQFVNSLVARVSNYRNEQKSEVAT